MPALVDTLNRLATPPRRRRVAHARLRARLPTSQFRVLPDFLVIGAQRCGTSSLYKYLGQHPCVAPPLRKEIDYFSRRYGNGLAWYRSHFAVRLRTDYARLARNRNLLSFEATPDYLLHPLAPTRAAELLPSARIIVLLRDPVERAHSHYQHMVRLGFESLSFTDAIEREPVRLGGELERILEEPLYDSRNLRLFSYVTRGMYAEQIERWMAHFPPEQILVLRSERLYGEPVTTYHGALDFLGLPRWQPAVFRNYSYRAAPPLGRSDTPEEARRLLTEHFEPANERLRTLLGWEGDVWRTR